jgi:hypothetical protein
MIRTRCEHKNVTGRICGTSIRSRLAHRICRKCHKDEYGVGRELKGRQYATKTIKKAIQQESIKAQTIKTRKKSD